MDYEREGNATKKKAVVAVLGVVIGIMLVIFIANWYFSSTTSTISVSTEAGIETQYVAKISGEKDFIDTVAWIHANGYSIVEDTYPKKVYVLEDSTIRTKEAKSMSEYVDLLLNVKYNDSLELYDKCIPEYVFYKAK